DGRRPRRRFPHPSQAMTESQTNESRSGSRARTVILAVAGLALLLFLGRRGASFVPGILDAIRGLGPWAWAAYIALYVVAAVAWIPGSLLTLASGAIFGLWGGTLLTLIGATLGATAAFVVARYVARSAIERRLGHNPKLAAIDRALARQGPKLVFLIRLSPAFPFNVLNYAMGLTGVRLWSYVWTTFLGILPGTFMYVYAGYAAGQIATAAEAGPRGPAYWALIGVGGVATVAVTVLVTRIARRAVEEATEPDSEAGPEPTSAPEPAADSLS
ncbi:MAG: TVP38/TMEM64 family protein, partial [Longimicrobiales bacterium]|nr:TVP38/TMEM64 family protein [Longimicrobiales bacterium]